MCKQKERTMGKKKKVVYPYIPNSEPSIKQQMLDEIGVADVEALYADIPEALRLNRKPDKTSLKLLLLFLFSTAIQ